MDALHIVHICRFLTIGRRLVVFDFYGPTQMGMHVRSNSQIQYEMKCDLMWMIAATCMSLYEKIAIMRSIFHARTRYWNSTLRVVGRMIDVK